MRATPSIGSEMLLACRLLFSSRQPLPISRANEEIERGLQSDHALREPVDSLLLILYRCGKLSILSFMPMTLPSASQRSFAMLTCLALARAFVPVPRGARSMHV